MAPLFEARSLIRAVECLPEDIHPGNIIVYCGNRHHVCHRVLLREHRGGIFWFFLSGNDPLRADGWIPAYRILGKVIEIEDKKLTQGLLKWKVRFFYWHGLLELVLLHKVFGGRFTRGTFLNLSARIFPRLGKARRLSRVNAADFALGSG